MNCNERIALRRGWKRWLPPNPFACEFCGYYFIGFCGACAVALVVTYACLTKGGTP